MTSTFQTSPGKLTIALSGDLIGGADALKFSVDLRAALTEKIFEIIEADASGVGFVNSSGLGMLIAARQSAQEHGAAFALKSPGNQLRQLLAITKLTEILGVV
jgi:anti-sigma B factor antagonist